MKSTHPSAPTRATPPMSAWARTVRMVRHGLLAGSLLAAVGTAAAVSLADQPLFTNTAVPGNLLLALSVEFPTAVSVAHQGTFVSGNSYLGYFDPEKCYKYQQGTEDEETGTAISHFYPAGMATGRKCTDSGLTDAWSGSFLNWLTMQAVDPFRWALTGGYRRVDTESTTILARAWATDNSLNGGDENFPYIPTSHTDALKRRPSPTGTDIADNTPLSLTEMRVSVRKRGNKVYFQGTGSLTNDSSVSTATHYSQTATIASDAIYYFYARVKVCEAATSPIPFTRESNCKEYPSGYYKPEGLLQQYAEKIRFGAFGYLNDPSNDSSNTKRDGGVLRARQKFVGPTVTNPGSTATTNAATEWSSTTGVMTLNPDSTDAANTASVFGVTVNNSGVMNYLNKFGQEYKTYKRYDPVSELYYGALRYLKNQGSISAWHNIGSDGNKSRLVDGFPVITTWDDPIQYSCQKNFILGIGDTNSHYDWNIPGSSGGGTEPTDPAELAADTTVNAVTATNKVGSLQAYYAGTLGTTARGNGNFLMAGLAYHANTQDIRIDDSTQPHTVGKQTVQTYWLDVLEFASYLPNNQYYLAAKFGGFKVPAGYDTYGQTTPLPEAWWRTNTDTVGTQPRPDNYFTVADPMDMVTGLRRAFSSIAAALRAYTTSFSTALPQVAIAGNASFAAQFDSENWTGEVAANELSFNETTGAPSQTPAWSFTTKLGTQLSGTGWDDNRRVITWDPAAASGAGAGVAFRATGSSAISATQLATLDTGYGTGDDSADYLNYLRGDRQHEQASTVSGSTHAYRTRAGLLGDVVGSKARPVGPPSLPLSNASNPGYGSFKTTWSTRPTVVYVGSNGGMLHAINGALSGAGTGILAPGAEMFAYVPSALFNGPTSTPATNGLAALGNPTFEHHYYVNATPAAFDIDFNRTDGESGTTPDWHSVLIGGLGKGGRSYFALDITNPAGMTTEALAAAKVLWEFTDTDMGYTYGEPTVVKTAKYGWVVLLPSGYNNSGEDHIFIVNPKTGALLEKVSTGASTGGLAHMNAFMLDRTDGTADAAYAGDSAGNVWRLDLTPATGAYAAPTKIATLANAANQAQPVTTRPLIETDPRTARRYVLLGTGIMLDNTHIGSGQQQSFYAIVDGKNTRFNASTDLPSGVSFPITRLNLANNTNNLVSADAPDYLWGSQIGWYIELGTGASGTVGWRVVNDPSAAFGIVTFAATLPNGDVCNPSGSSRIYAINFGRARSVLTDSTGFIDYSTAITGVVTDLRFFTVNGVPRLIAGSDSGELKAPPGQFSETGTVRRLNWREIPVAN